MPGQNSLGTDWILEAKRRREKSYSKVIKMGDIENHSITSQMSKSEDDEVTGMGRMALGRFAHTIH